MFCHTAGKQQLQHYASSSDLPYFFGYKTEFYSFLNSPKNLDPSYQTDLDPDPSYKMGLDLWECLGRVKLVFYQNFLGLIKSFVVI